MSGPLTGTTVVELCANVAGPFATKILGDMGADVIKVERVDSGSAMRQRRLPHDPDDIDGVTRRFLNYNTSKRSIALDLKSEPGTEVFERLLAECDVFVENLRPGAVEALGFNWERLKAINSRLIFCSIKGYGPGPMANQPAIDTLVQGMSGFATQVGDGDGPETMQVTVIDMMTALYAALSVSMALNDRGRVGGQRITVSMLDAAVSMLGHQLAEYSGGRADDEHTTDYGSMFVPNGYFRTADGYIAVLVMDDYWEDFCSAIGRPKWSDPDHRYATNERRREAEGRLEADLEDVLTSASTDTWMNRFESHEGVVLAAPVNTIDEMIEDEQVRAQETVLERTHPQFGRYVTPNAVPRFDGDKPEVGDAPNLGEHTGEVLESLGFTSEEVRRLRDNGVVD